MREHSNLNQALGSLIGGEVKGLIVNYTPGHGTVSMIRDFMEKNRVQYVQAIFPSWRSDLAYQLFSFLKNNADRVIIMHDARSLLKDPASSAMLKACLESGRAPVAWARVGQRDLIEFTGRLIIVENEVDDALRVRCNLVNIKVS